MQSPRLFVSYCRLTFELKIPKQNIGIKIINPKINLLKYLPFNFENF